MLILYDGGRADIGVGNTTTTRRVVEETGETASIRLELHLFLLRQKSRRQAWSRVHRFVVFSNVQCVEIPQTVPILSQPLLSPLSMLFSRNDLWLQFDEGIEGCRNCHSLEEGDQRRTFGMIRYAPCFSCATLSKQHVEVSCPSQTTAQRFS